MKSEDITDPYKLKPVLTSDGKQWTQRCYVCSKPVNFLHSSSYQWIRVGTFVRHRKCKPDSLGGR